MPVSRIQAGSTKWRSGGCVARECRSRRSLTTLTTASASRKSPNSLKSRRIASRRYWLTLRVTALRILFDKNVPAGVRRFLSAHEVRTFMEMLWHPRLENGLLLKAAETAGFDVMVTPVPIRAATKLGTVPTAALKLPTELPRRPRGEFGILQPLSPLAQQTVPAP